MVKTSMNPRCKSTLKSLAEVIFSNTTTIISGIIVGFVIPKVTSVEGYGFCKTFSLYIAYTGLLSMGIIDGIVLRYGGVDYSDYDCPLFRSIFRWYCLIQAFFVIIVLSISAYIEDENYRFIIIALSIYLFFANLTGYFQQISQITQKFREYSASKVIQSIIRIVGGLALLVLYLDRGEIVDYRLYIGITTAEYVLISIGYIIIYRQIVFGNAESLKKTKTTMVHLAKTGWPLLIANLCVILILSLDRQLVNLVFPNSEYAVYAFAYNMLTLITVATSAVSTVLYPAMKRTNEIFLNSNFSKYISYILIFVYGAIVVYFPLCKFIHWFLPQYTSSLPIFRVVLPGLAISSAVSVIMQNYYKTLGENIIFFKKCLLILLISAGLNIAAYMAFRNTLSISIASIVTIIIWYLISEQYFVECYGYCRRNNIIYFIILMLIFYITSSISNLLLAGILYVIGYISFSTVFFRRILFNVNK